MSIILPISHPTAGATEAPGFANKLYAGHAADVMSSWPEHSVDLVVTSPPYWTAVQYDGSAPVWGTYEDYLADMYRVWKECARVLRPNGKLCINAPVMPIPKTVVEQHTRHLKNIASDMEAGILFGTDLGRVDKVHKGDSLDAAGCDSKQVFMMEIGGDPGPSERC